MIRFTRENWNRYWTHNKKMTTRTHPVREGHHNVFTGSRFKPVKIGELDITSISEKPYRALTEEDAKNDGFDSLEEYKAELCRLNKGIIDDTPLFLHMTENVTPISTGEEQHRKLYK